MKAKSFLKGGVGLFLMGAFIGTISPSPVDPIYFWLENYVIPNMTGVTKIFWQIFNWYILDALWYLSLIILAFTMHIKKVKTIKIIHTVMAIIGLGAAIGIIFKVLNP